jgi:hypothetical protein
VVWFTNKNGTFFGAESAKFGLLLLLAKLTPAMPFLVEFCWEKEGGDSYWDNFCYRKPFFTFFWSILGLFDLLEPLEQVSEPLEVIFR